MVKLVKSKKRCVVDRMGFFTSQCSLRFRHTICHKCKRISKGSQVFVSFAARWVFSVSFELIKLKAALGVVAVTPQTLFAFREESRGVKANDPLERPDEIVL